MVIGLLDQLAARCAEASRQVTCGVLLRTADVKKIGGAVGLLLPAPERGPVDNRHSGFFRQLADLLKTRRRSPRFLGIAALLVAIEGQSGQRPTDGAVT